ncbi:hypothetical protein [Sorangium sp. So ce145]|uniref:hypothetical protein n=1 Tax=Sorangium sp. So ce145 TaxID=3133285 RepID=UPI003F60DD06
MSRLIVLLVLGLTGCNFDMGECYVRGHGTEGAGGGIITPTGGVGGFGYVPLQPQNHTGYDEDPCSGGSQLAECTVTWKAGSTQCKNWGETGPCTSLYQGQHASLDEAKERCEYANGVHLGSGAQSCGPCRWVNGANDDPVERCKKNCEAINRDCIKNCRMGDQDCMYKCNLELGDCLKDCER